MNHYKTRYVGPQILETLDPSRFLVLSGSIHRDHGEAVNVTKIILHEKFIPGQHYHDIALLTLENEVDQCLKPVCLPSPELSIRDLTGANTTMLGWGHTSYVRKDCNFKKSVQEIPLRGSPSLGEYESPNPKVPKDLFSLQVYPPIRILLFADSFHPSTEANCNSP
ncbi:hypothetical protein AVEN_28329-1 [Araneus ventricosus]|uniref:Peptidase S1 domain-containing protein n=1 Tax=Araneus ventricosus TaxID=182803 RepID=A0A4Y2TUW6_ARAVE|nr:hypothetical protein AVEN_28329-1 [Araneus ventricosus]